MTTEILTGDAAVAEGNALSTRRPISPARLAAMSEAADLFGRVLHGNMRARADFVEAMSTSDFQYIFGQILDRELLATYEQLPSMWPMFARRSVVRDFRAKKYDDLLGGRAVLEKVPELAPYPERKPTENEYSLSVAKYGALVALSWEMIVNDDLDALRDMPNRLAQGAKDTEDYIATQQLTDGDGPNATLFSATAVNGTSTNLLTANPVLSTNNLSAALTAISSRRDGENRPIAISGFILVVPPALEVTALQILNATVIRNVVSGQEVEVGNWLRGKVEVVVDPWLPVIDANANVNTTWYVLPKPSTARPAVVLGFLRGHETPDLRVKADTGSRVGGGNIPAEEGSFDVDDVQYRVRHVIGGTTLDPIAAAYSSGAGS